MLVKNKMNSRLILIIVLIATYSFASCWAWWSLWTQSFCRVLCAIEYSHRLFFYKK